MVAVADAVVAVVLVEVVGIVPSAVGRNGNEYGDRERK